jgi:hypothetical protein
MNHTDRTLEISKEMMESRRNWRSLIRGTSCECRNSSYWMLVLMIVTLQMRQ